jgi:hypothetical protein
VLVTRLVPFSPEQQDAYIRAATALQARRAAVQRFGPLQPLSRGDLGTLQSDLESRLGDSCARQIVAALRMSTLDSGAQAVSLEMLKERRLFELCPAKSEVGEVDELRAVISLLTALRAATGSLSPAAAKKQVDTLCALLRDAWSFTDYTKKLSELSELQELLTTPFMLEIVVQILPHLSSSAVSLGTVKVRSQPRP